MEALPKTYDPARTEGKWYAYWTEHRLFESDPDGRPPFTIVIPPPNVTGVLHMGHLLNNTLQDILIRRKRQEGYNACWVPGTDHASIATEARVVKMLREQGIRKSDLSREEFLAHAWEWKEKYGGIILEQLKRLGASCDWRRTRFTMEPKLTASVLRVFVDLHRRGLVYRGLRMVHWDPAGLTALSDEEVVYTDEPGQLYHLRYALQDRPGEYVTIATKRPETIFADVAIAVNPRDNRFAHLVGQQALIPLIDRPIPIIADDYVDMEFGTGCLKVTPAHDPNDYEIGQRHGLPTLDILTPDGRIAESSPRYVGQDRFEARESILTDLQTAGALVKTETLMGRVGRSERTNAVIEPRLSLQWFVDMKRLAEPALKAVLEGEVKLLPERFVNTYRHWMENIRDWCISRQLWWGQQIPAYFYGPNPDDYVVALTRAEAWELARAKGYAGAEAELVQDPDVLDTWFSSWLWPITVFDGLEEPHNPDFTYYYPTQDLVTGPDILFFWVARMIMAGYAFTDRKPFTNVYLTGIIRDSQRRKLSKSLGNSPDVLELIDKYGADAVRMGLMMSSSAGNDILYDEALCETGRNFANKIWNALRLVDSLASRVVPGELNARENLAVQWLNTRIQAVADEMRQQLGSYNILEAARSIYKLIWDDFCSTYLELIKPGYGEPLSQAALAQTKAAFGLQMQLLHPFMPFLTEEVWQALAPRQPGQSVGLHLLPSFDEMPTHLLGGMAHALEVVSALRTFRAEKHISPKERLALTAKTPDAAWLAAFAPAICHLGGLASLAATHTQPADCQTLVVGTTELYVPHSAANVDVAAERAKLTEELAYQQGFLESVRKKLGNEKFVANAKPDVVANERKKETDALAKIAVLQEALAQLG